MILDRLLSFLTPVQCLECGAEGEVLCVACVRAGRQNLRPRCFGCGRTSVDGSTCAACRQEFSLLGASVGVNYAGSVRDLILRLKFHRLRSAADVAAELVVSGLPKDRRVDVVTSVPISPARYRERGYNQSELIARGVAARLALPYASLLIRTTSVHQLGEDRRTRLEQVRGAFAASRRVDGLRVLVVDDVITTGATLDQCAEVLKYAGAEWIWGAVVARRLREAGDLA